MKLKSLYLIVLMLCINTAIFAQEKYEQAILETYMTTLAIAIHGSDTQVQRLEKGQDGLKTIFDQIAKMQNEGWEVWNSGVIANGGIVYFLRRKVK